MSDTEIEIRSHKYSANQIRGILHGMGSGEIQEQKTDNHARGADPTVLVAIVGATGTVTGALIAGLFQLISGKKNEKIVLRSSDGTSIEFPASMSSEKLNAMLGKLKDLEKNKYQILLP